MAGKKSAGVSELHAASAEVDRAVMRTGIVVWKSAAIIEHMGDEGVVLKKITLKAPVGQGGDWLAVVTAGTEGEALVAFHSGQSLRECLEGALNRLENRSLTWKKDSYG
jgi:hypothetical protein